MCGCSNSNSVQCELISDSSIEWIVMAVYYYYYCVCIYGSPDRSTHDGEFSYLVFLVFSLVVLGWSGCCQICHLSLFSLYHRRVFLCMFRGRVLVILWFLCIYGIWYPCIFPEVVLDVQHSCSRFEDGGCFRSLQFFHVFWSFPCFPVFIFSQKLYLRFSSACFLYVMSEVSFQLLWVDIFVVGILQGFVNMFPHSGCGFFPSSCCVCFHYFGCYILRVFM